MKRATILSASSKMERITDALGTLSKRKNRIDSKKEVSNNFYCILVVLVNSSLSLPQQRKR